MQSIVLIALQLLLVLGCAFAGSSEESSDSSYESEFSLRDMLCEGADEETKTKIVDCVNKMDLTVHEDSLRECYSNLIDISGDSMQQWYCSHTDDESDKADECWQNKLAEKDETAFEEMVNTIIDCLVPEEEEEEEENAEK
ncbi:hypothetical protein NPIL_450101 [Nephila pilipes]|uniref:Secreted protein n=1 Tax=Nephila pilipes TaxID=299642 RepID=A0A8X6ULD5_NEPPI|nr:hypothetical protein NPIL_450101 [Nephila pilipes]